MRASSWLPGLALVGVAVASPSRVRAAPPATVESSESSESSEQGRLEGRVRAAGRRTPLAEATVMIVAAPSDARPGHPARVPLNPDDVTWIRETKTDEQGRFALDELPVGTVRIVILAQGYARTELFAAVGRAPGEPIELFIEPGPTAGFRTEVVSERHVEDAQPDHRIDAEQARVYPGSGGDPVRAVQNLPGVARSPGGLGMIAIRGGDPRQTGVYLDGHPIPRGFHVLPIASVVAPGMVESVELTPGNYDAGFGGHAAGLLHIRTRSGPLAGVDDRAIHGEAHLDLFDFGGTVAGPVGPGAVTFGFRRAHVGDVVTVVDNLLPPNEQLNILLPNYWDYLGRFDMPLGKRHQLTLRVLGAGDTLREANGIAGTPVDFGAAFHRIDLAHAFEFARWRTSLSAALRLDSSDLDVFYGNVARHAWVPSLRATASYELSRHATLVAGLDLVDEHWQRAQSLSSYDYETGEVIEEIIRSRGRDLAFGTWLGVALRYDPRPGPVIVRMQVRLNVFSDGHEARVMPDPRADLRFRVHPRVELLAALGQYSFSQVVQAKYGANLFSPESRTDGRNGVIDIPIWLLTYFDPGIEGEVAKGSLLLGRSLQASTGVRLELPWRLGARATGFWREIGPQSRVYVDEQFGRGESGFPRSRAYGLELLLDRALSRDIHGWVGYTLLRSRNYRDGTEGEPGKWLPADFDQRHNLVALVSVELPRGFRLGARFRVVSGNPDRPIYGKIIADEGYAGLSYTPIRGEIGSVYRPTFHQLDLRVDKTWHAKRASISAYLDVQNVYNNLYPELWTYTADYRERGAAIGLPIFPSLGLRVDY